MTVASLSEEATRFARALDRLVPAGETLGLAVSGGPDSLALVQLALEARPGMLRAVTIDHRLRPGSDAEAASVASLCAERAIPHDTIAIDWPDGPPDSNVEAAARTMRYDRIADWAHEHGVHYVATAHHADDQAETLVMRLARGAGLSGLAGIRRTRALREGVMLVRPLLDWQKSALVALCARHGLPFSEDPMNADPRFDRVKVRDALRDADFADAGKYAQSAAHLGEAEDALVWTAERLADERLRATDEGWALVRGTIPNELLRRLLLVAFERLGDRPPRGPDLVRAMEMLEAGGQCSLGQTLLRVEGDRWMLEPAPPRRT